MPPVLRRFTNDATTKAVWPLVHCELGYVPVTPSNVCGRDGMCFGLSSDNFLFPKLVKLELTLLIDDDVENMDDVELGANECVSSVGDTDTPLSAEVEEEEEEEEEEGKEEEEEEEVVVFSFSNIFETI